MNAHQMRVKRQLEGRRRMVQVACVYAVLIYLAICLGLGPGMRAPSLHQQILEEGLTFQGALRIAERLDTLADRLEALPVGRTPEDLELLAQEIVQYYAYEGISDRCYLPPVTLHVYKKDQAFHVLGSCTMGFRPFVYLNARYANPWSPRWYTRADLLAVMVHEIGHAQGIASLAQGNWTEPATQLATVEVLAAMVRDRNVYALVPLLRELQKYAEYYAMEIALREGRMEEYRAHIGRVANNRYEIASFERAMTHWSSRMEQLHDILTRYGRWPWIFLNAALQADGYLTRPFACVPNDTGRIKMDDLAYVLEDLPALLRDYDKLVEGMR